MRDSRAQRERGALLAAVQQRYAYDAYGNMLSGAGYGVLVSSSNAWTRLLYSGEQTDKGTGLQYLRARFYDPRTGRFTSRDPLAGDNYDPQSLHRYLYVHGDPIGHADPTGNEWSLVGVAMASGITGSLIGISVGAYIGVRETGTLFSLRTGAYALVGALAGFGIGASTGALIYELLPLTSGIGSGGVVHNFLKVMPKIVQVMERGPQSLFAIEKGKVLASFVVGTASGGLAANASVPEIVGFFNVGSTTAVSLLFQSVIKPSLNRQLAVYVSGSIDLTLSFTLGYLAGYYAVRGEQYLLERVVDAGFKLL